MTDLICRKTMQRCQTPGMCRPHGGCRPDQGFEAGHLDLGKFVDWVWNLRAERDQLKAENEALRSGSAIKRMTCAEVREAFNQAYYQPREIGSDGEQCRAGVLSVIDAAMAKEASHDR